MKRWVAAYVRVLPPSLTRDVPGMVDLLQRHMGDYAWLTVVDGDADSVSWETIVQTRKALADEARAILEHVEALAEQAYSEHGIGQAVATPVAGSVGVDECKGPE